MIQEHDSLYPNGYNLRNGGAKGASAEATKQAHRNAWARPGFREMMVKKFSEAANRPEVKARNIAINKARMEDPANRDEISVKTKAAMARPEVRERLLVAVGTPESKAKLAHGVREAGKRPEVRERRHNAALQREADPNVRAKRAATRANPEYQKRHSDGIRKALAVPEVKERQRTGIKTALERPETRKALSTATTAGWANEAIRASRIAGIKALRWWCTPEGKTYRSIEPLSPDDRPGRK